MSDAPRPDGEERAPRERLALGGFGPLVVAVILALLAVVLVPSVAPEHVVTRPVTTTVTTATGEAAP